MDPIAHAENEMYREHLAEARRVLALPIEVSSFHWHPFGVYAIPLAKRREGDAAWSRRLHIWHPETTPVGETSIYGVHTHSGTAMSHVLAGTLHHHLYDFVPDVTGVWVESNKTMRRGAKLLAHAQGATTAGVTHTLPANQPHGVSKPPGFALSLFEQRDGWTQPFTTWQRQDAPPEALVLQAPVDPERVLREARLVVEEACALAGVRV